MKLLLIRGHEVEEKDFGAHHTKDLLIGNRTNNKTLDTAICYTSGAHNCFIIHALRYYQSNLNQQIVFVFWHKCHFLPLLQIKE